MGKIKIDKPGMYSSIQDFGRIGYAYYAIPPSGVMDKGSAFLANKILGNPDNCPVLEMTIIPPQLTFLTDAVICLTGSNMNFKINNIICNNYQAIKVNKGDILNGNPSSGSHRSYLAVNGMFKTLKHYGSASTYSNAKLGGLSGTKLKQEDILEWNDTLSKNLTFEFTKEKHQIQAIQINKGPEFDWLPQESKVNLIESFFTIQTDSNRMGARLKGPNLEIQNKHINRSLPVLPGFIQLPPSGSPIVILQDGQTTGGYPRIAYIRQDELSKFNQIPISKPFQFALDLEF
ncbi:MAG: biotin-dependent carboxyltransferase family protein [Saprospiraceae bacterium]|nr:biotin-dependent carboxyltransferase family protein [Bacteroidia bacterium]NNE14626.1 biotin-dependent carboxyltransferase family protein [Saprospiraceae bacterium]